MSWKKFNVKSVSRSWHMILLVIWKCSAWAFIAKQLHFSLNGNAVAHHSALKKRFNVRVWIQPNSPNVVKFWMICSSSKTSEETIQVWYYQTLDYWTFFFWLKGGTGNENRIFWGPYAKFDQSPRNLKGESGLFLIPVLMLWGGGHIDRRVWRWVIVPYDLAQSFGTICAYYH